MSSRPRPKPKPRAIPKPTEPSNAGPSTQVDDDSMFLKNKSRSKNTWSRLDHITKDVKGTKNDSDSDNGSETERSPKRHKKPVKDAKSSGWQNMKDPSRVLSIEISSDEDDVVALNGIEKTPSRDRRGKSTMKPPTRDRSITPPPALSWAKLNSVSELVRQALAPTLPPRTSSPDYEEEASTDTIILAPELVQLQKKVKLQYQQSGSLPASSDKDQVELRVTWKPHPLHPTQRPRIFEYRVGRSETFEALFEAVAEDGGVFASNVKITHNGHDILPTATPRAFGMWGKAELEGCDASTFKYLQEQLAHARTLAAAERQAQPSPQKAPPVSIDLSDDEDDIQIVPSQAEPESDAGSDAGNASETEGETFKLILRSNEVKKNIMLTVRPTTKCGSIVKAYLKKVGLAENYPSVFASAPPKNGSRKRKSPVAEKDPRLSIDGEKVDNNQEIGEMDLEDGDQIDVVGL